MSDWTSTAGEAKQLTGVLKGGSAYILHEIKAPAGFELADPVSFTVKTSEVGPTKEDLTDSIQRIVMVDPKVGTAAKKGKTNPKSTPTQTALPAPNDRRGTPGAKGSGTPQTNDPAKPELWFLLLLASGIAEAALLPGFLRRKHRD